MTVSVLAKLVHVQKFIQDCLQVTKSKSTPMLYRSIVKHRGWVILYHPQSAIVGIILFLKFGLDRIYSFGDIAIFIFCHFGLKLPIHGHFRDFWRHISSK